jgi:hypothetical protein
VRCFYYFPHRGVLGAEANDEILILASQAFEHDCIMPRFIPFSLYAC